jgi:aminopeptidase
VDASTPRSPSPDDLRRYADLLVGFGANVRRGQILEARGTLQHLPLLREIAASAYRRGARFVDVGLHDPWVRRARIEHGDPDGIGFVPSWHRERVLELGRQRCARIGLSPTNEPDVLDGVDPELAAREPLPFIAEYHTIIDENTTNWSGGICPTPGWAQLVHPRLEPAEALATVWAQVLHICRLDEDDPVAVWERRLAQLTRAERRLNELRLDALHFEGPGTDLVVGLLPGSRWASGASETVDGIRHVANVPTEEVFTAPDPARTEGTVRSTRPLQLEGGVLVEGLRVRFEAGRAVELEADRGAGALRVQTVEDEGAARLGEVALVDGEGRVGALDTVFYSTLLDENAASHVAFGSAYPETVEEAEHERMNRSSVHIDFMLGGDDVDVTGVSRSGERIPVLRGGAWRI